MKTVLLVITATSALLRGQQINPNQLSPTGAYDFHLATLRPPESTVAMLPLAGLNINRVFLVLDGTSSADCTIGGSTNRSWCVSNGSAWVTLGGVGSGTVTSITTACGIVGGPLTTTGTVKLSPAVVTQAGNYLTASGDCGLTEKLTGASPAVTIPAAGGSFPNGWVQYFSFTGTGTAVFTPSSGTINGLASISLPAANGAGGTLESDGTNWIFTSGGGSGGGATSFTGLIDFAVTNASATVQNMGLSCSNSQPCQVRNNYVGSPILTSVATGTLSGVSVGGVNDAWWYWSSQLVLTLGHNSASTLTCNGNCNVATGITGFPVDSIPLWHTTFTSLAWNAVVPATMDKRASMANYPVKAGPGNSEATDPTTGIKTISTDSTITPRYFTGTIAPTPGAPNCTAGRDRYTDTVALHDYFCDAANTWKQADSGGTVTEMHTFQACAGYNSGGVAYPLWELVSATASPIFIGGSVGNACAISFNNSGTAEVRIHYVLNPNWSGTVSVTFETESLAGAGVVNTLSVKTACLTNGSTFIPPTFNAPQALTVTSNASANVVTTLNFPSLTMAGCSGGKTLVIDVIKTDVNATLNVMRMSLQDSHS